jgi:hypothetical protein
LNDPTFFPLPVIGRPHCQFPNQSE